MHVKLVDYRYYIMCAECLKFGVPANMKIKDLPKVDRPRDSSWRGINIEI